MFGEKGLTDSRGGWNWCAFCVFGGSGARTLAMRIHAGGRMPSRSQKRGIGGARQVILGNFLPNTELATTRPLTCIQLEWNAI